MKRQVHEDHSRFFCYKFCIFCFVSYYVTKIKKNLYKNTKHMPLNHGIPFYYGGLIDRPF